MITYAIQPDYGGINLRFLGVSLRFHAQHPSTWELFNEIGTESRSLAKVAEIGNKALKNSPEQAFEIFSVGTVLSHEMRHFHDFILSPFGNTLFRLHLTTVMNGLQAALPILSNYKIIPIPIPVWMSKSDSEKAAFLTQWVRGHPIEKTFTLSDSTEVLVKQTAATYSKLKNFLINPQTKSQFEPSHLFEASAILTQIQSVYNVFGLEHAQLFLNFLLEHPATSSYSVVFQLLHQLWEEAGLLSNARTINSIVMWCLLGDYLNDGWNACPTIRFMRLFKLLRTDGLPSRKPVIELFQEWTKRLSYTPIATAFSRNVVANNRFITKLEKVYDDYPSFMTSYITDILQTVKMLARMNEYMSKLFIDNPDLYVYPHSYIENLETWVAAPIAVDFFGGGLVVNKNDLDKLLKKFQIPKLRSLKNENDKAVILRMLVPGKTAGVDMIDTDTVLRVSEALTLNDFLFSEFRSDPDFDMWRGTFQEIGITPLEIII